MNIFSFKKQKNPVVGHKQKLFLFSAIILIVVSIFPVISRSKEALALSKSIFLDGTISDETATGNCPTDKMPFWYGIQVSKAEGQAPPEGIIDVGTQDEILINVTINPGTNYDSTLTEQQRTWLAKIKENCMTAVDNGQISFRLSPSGINPRGASGVNFDEAAIRVPGLENTFGVSFPKFKLSKTSGFETDTIPLKLTLSNRGSNLRSNYHTFNFRVKDGTFGVDDPSVVPIGSGGTVGNGSETRALSDIKIITTLRDKYRVLRNETEEPFQQIKFGSNGVDPISMKWASPQNSLVKNQEFELTEKDDYVGPTFNPWFLHIRSGINYAENVNSKNVGCESSRWSGNDCSKVIFTDREGSETSGLGKESGSVDGLPFLKFDPTINQKAWQEKVPDGTSQPGKPLGTVQFAYLPVIWGDNQYINGATEDIGVVMNRNPAKFTVEVYKTEDDLIAACKADGLGDEVCGSKTGRRYGVGKLSETTSGTNETPADTPGQTLYEFIVKIISAVVIFLTSMVYRIFALFVVPVINALLNVKPYQDAFVNIIYAGWLILRNLANIFFIIALLVVGLRILFQQSAAGAARGFIIRLVLMALLVNFSLVIAQGVVGIADTVQSQFLPGNTRVIEALGSKLMVEPIVSFRSAVGGGDVNGQIQGDANVGDIAKPIVLLMLAVAAFFSFLAIAAFLAVRLVALMILYMVSPIAYVGYVMDETKSYAQRWWSEFIKYAFLTPILVFFLNIAALVATATASNNGNVFDMQTDGLSADIVTAGLTIVSHFIVLLIIFAGMKYALSSGTIGAKTIVNYAKKGFDAVTTRPAKWAAGAAGSAAKKAGMFSKDFAGDKISDAFKKRNWDKSAALVSAIAQPKLTKDALKKKLFTEPKEKQMKRLAEKRAGLESFASDIGNNPGKALQMIGWKLRGKGADFFNKQANDLKRISTDEELQNEQDKIDASNSQLEEVQRRLGNDDKYISKQQAEIYRDELDKSIKSLNSEKSTRLNDLTKQKAAAIAVGNKARVNELENDINNTRKDFDNRIADQQAARDDIHSRIDSLPDGTGPNEALEMASKDGAAMALSVNADVLKAAIKKSETVIDDNNRLRSAYGFAGPIDEAKKSLIIKQAEELESTAVKRGFPRNSPGDIAERISKENEEGKKYDGIDDPEALRVAFEGAMKKNNIAAAVAIAKKLSKEGGFADLLKDAGFNNNVGGFQKFMEEKFKNMPVQVRNQVASEISYVNSQNGNRSIGNATKIDADRVVRFNTLQEQQSKLSKSAAKKALWERKKNDVTYQDNNGEYKFNAGEFDDINKIKPSGLKEIAKRVKPDMAEHILKVAEKQRLPLRDDVKAWLLHTADPAGHPEPDIKK